MVRLSGYILLVELGTFLILSGFSMMLIPHLEVRLSSGGTIKRMVYIGGEAFFVFGLSLLLFRASIIAGYSFWSDMKEAFLWSPMSLFFAFILIYYLGWLADWFA